MAIKNETKPSVSDAIKRLRSTIEGSKMIHLGLAETARFVGDIKEVIE
jgi:hypothetical protein